MSKERYEMSDCDVYDNELNMFVDDYVDRLNEQDIHKKELLKIKQRQEIKIADLEAKLAESEEKCKKAYQEGLLQKQFDKDMEIEQLNQQLAEKDKEIEKLKQLVKAVDIYNQYSNDAKNLILLNPDNCYANGHKAVIKIDKQEKIDYAVEQLKKVKEWVCDYSDLKGQNWDHTLRYLNNQIKQLKEGK